MIFYWLQGTKFSKCNMKSNEAGIEVVKLASAGSVMLILRYNDDEPNESSLDVISQVHIFLRYLSSHAHANVFTGRHKEYIDRRHDRTIREYYKDR